MSALTLSGACLLISGTGRDTLSLTSNTLSSGSDGPLKVFEQH